MRANAPHRLFTRRLFDGHLYFPYTISALAALDINAIKHVGRSNGN
jgi:hypothetical protein